MFFIPLVNTIGGSILLNFSEYERMAGRDPEKDRSDRSLYEFTPLTHIHNVGGSVGVQKDLSGRAEMHNGVQIYDRFYGELVSWAVL